MSFNLSGLAALGQGYQQGQFSNVDLQQRQLQLQQQRRQETAKALMSKFMQSPDSPLWTQLAVGPTPAGAAGDGAPAAPPPATTPMGGGQPPMGGAQPPTGGAQPPMGGAPAAAPQGPAGGAQPPPDQAPLGPGSLSGAAKPSGDPYVDALRTVHSIYVSLRQQNPKADDATIADAAEQVLGSTKGLQPEVKAQAQAMLQFQKQQFQAGQQTQREDHQDRLAAVREGWRQRDASTQFGYRKDLEAVRAGNQQALERMRASAAMGRTSAEINARYQMFSQGLAQRASEFQDRTQLSELNEKGKAAFSLQAQGARELNVAANTPDPKQRDALTKSGMAKIQEGEKQLQGLGGEPEFGAPLDDGGAELPPMPQAPAAQRPAAPRPAAPRPAGGQWKAPADLPSPKGHADGTIARDGSGRPVAKVVNGQWAQP